MLITPLQNALRLEANRTVVKQNTGFSRTTIWRWQKGISYPSKDDAELLMGILNLDFNGIYEKSVEVTE